MAQAQTNIRNRLLRALSPEDFGILQPLLEPAAFKPRESVAEADTMLPYVYFVNSGIISVLADRPGDRIEVGIIGREGLAGAAAAFGAIHTPYKLMCQAEAETFRMNADDLEKATRSRPSLASVVGRYLHYLTIQIGQTAYANASLNIEARLARWVLMTNDRVDSFELPLTHDFLATMLGTRRPGVTTAIHVLEGAGMIRAERGIITVVDRAKLENLASDAYGVAESEYDRLFGSA
jgi:CRP-like cAMP-binding protein